MWIKFRAKELMKVDMSYEEPPDWFHMYYKYYILKRYDIESYVNWCFI